MLENSTFSTSKSALSVEDGIRLIVELFGFQPKMVKFEFIDDDGKHSIRPHQIFL